MMRNNTNNTSSANSQLDEGYSEETRSQPDSDMVFTGMEDTSSPDGRMAECVNAVVGLPAEKRQREFIIHFTLLTSTTSPRPASNGDTISPSPTAPTIANAPNLF
jgi:hypothetical protein